MSDRHDQPTLTGTADELRLAGDERASGVLLQAAADAEHTGDGERMAEALLSYEVGVATNFMRDDPRTVALLRRALELLPDRDSAARARVLASLALNAMNSLPEPERRTMADEALAMSRRVGSGRPRVGAHRPSVDRDGAAAPARAPRHGRRARAHRSASLALRGVRRPPLRYLSLVEDGDMRAADAALTAARSTARLPVSLWSVCQWEAARAVLAGRLDDAEQLMLQGAQAAQEAGFQLSVIQRAAASVLWCIRRTQGRLRELHDAMRALETDPARPAWTRAGEAQVAMARGDEQAGREAIEAAFAAGLIDMPQGLFWLSTMTGAADVCAWLGDRSRAETLYSLLKPCADVMSPWTGPVALSASALALALGRHADAENHARDAVALCERMDATAFLAIARCELGRLLLRSADGRALLEQTRAEADRLAMPGWVARADGALATARASAPSHQRHDEHTVG